MSNILTNLGHIEKRYNESTQQIGFNLDKESLFKLHEDAKSSADSILCGINAIGKLLFVNNSGGEPLDSSTACGLGYLLFELSDVVMCLNEISRVPGGLADDSPLGVS